MSRLDRSRTVTERIPMAELRRVMHCVAPYTDGDEDEPTGHVLLSVEGGRRMWSATDRGTLVRLAGGHADGDVCVTVPVRLLAVPFEHNDDAVLHVGGPDDRGRPRLALRWGDVDVALPAGPDGFPDVALLAQGLEHGPAAAARVDPRALGHVLDQLHASPIGAHVGADESPPLWLEVADGELVASVDWGSYGTTTARVRADTAGRARMSVVPCVLRALISHLQVTPAELRVPTGELAPLWATDGEWSLYVMPSRPWPSVEEVGMRAMALLADVVGQDALTADTDGPVVVLDGVGVAVRAAAGEPPGLSLTGTVVRGLRLTRDLLAEVNEVNAGVRFARVVCAGARDGTRVEVRADLPAADLRRSDVEAVVADVRRVIRLRDVLAGRFGGRAAAPWPRPPADDVPF